MARYAYGKDVLAGSSRPGGTPVPSVEARPDLVVECASSGFCGAVVGLEKDAVWLEDRHGKRRAFALTPGAFRYEGALVSLVRPTSVPPVGRARTASGSVHVAGLRAQVARASRIYVEGKHDAELVEKVWGHDLRVEGVVVEELDGVDLLPQAVARVRPWPRPPAGRPGRPPRPRLEGVPDRRRCPSTRTCSSSVTRTSTSGRRYVLSCSG